MEKLEALAAHELALKAVSDSEEHLNRIESAKGRALHAERRGGELVNEIEDQIRQVFVDGGEPGSDLLRQTAEAREAKLIFGRVLSALSVDQAEAKFAVFERKLEEAEARAVMFGALLAEHIGAQAEVAKSLAEIEGGDVQVAIDGPRSMFLKEEVRQAQAMVESMRGRLPIERHAVQAAREQVAR